MGHLNGWGECMNNPEVTMHDQQQPARFDALEKATTLLVRRWAAGSHPAAQKAGDPGSRDQGRIRAACRDGCSSRSLRFNPALAQWNLRPSV